MILDVSQTSQANCCMNFSFLLSVFCLEDNYELILYQSRKIHKNLVLQ